MGDVTGCDISCAGRVRGVDRVVARRRTCWQHEAALADPLATLPVTDEPTCVDPLKTAKVTAPLLTGLDASLVSKTVAERLIDWLDWEKVAVAAEAVVFVESVGVTTVMVSTCWPMTPTASVLCTRME